MTISRYSRRIKIGRSVYLVENGKKVIVKYEPLVTNSTMQRFSRFMFRGSLPFKNEMYVNELLNNCEFKYFKYPKSVIHKKNKRIDFEFVEGVEETIRKPSEKVFAVKSLIEYSKLWRQYKISGFTTGLALKAIESPWLKTFRSMMFSRQKLSIKLKAFFILVVFLFRKRITSPVLLHNDLQCKNVMRTKDGGLYFIDFEDATIERRLIVVDVVNILFDKKMLKLDRNTLTLFWDAFVQSNVGSKLAETLLKEQVKICFLRFIFAPCSRDRVCPENKLVIKKLLSITMDDQRFDEWWCNQ